MAQKTRASAPRKRRSPEQAQAELLDAAERLIAERGPDGVGLQAVAKEAGVSHALVTHYFGTYDGLVSAVLERVTRRAREEALAKLADPAWSPEQGPLLDVLFGVLHNPAHVRLLVWSALTGRADAGKLLESLGGLGQIVEGLQGFYQRTTGQPPTPELKAEIEFGVMVGICASFGYAVGGEHLQRAFGHAPTPEAERAFRERLRGLIFGHVVGSLSPGPSPVGEGSK